ncbi:chymotrypsinogen B-like [Ornithodoros turicata]|uniref:chymotrypsinogen B-like n=1 Tax=Ornithodoros turicata TaxID=34597 RepID=UPI003139EF50
MFIATALCILLFVLRTRSCLLNDFPIPTSCGQQQVDNLPRTLPWVVTIQVEAIADIRSPEDILPCPNAHQTLHTNSNRNTNMTSIPQDFFFGHLSRMAVTHRISSSCSGVIVSARHVLTAAHCLFSSHYRPTYRVFHRTNDAQTYLKHRRRDVLAVESATWHPHCKFHGTLKAIYDLAILVLSEPLDFAATKAVYSPICLPWPDLNVSDMVTWMAYNEAAASSSVYPEASQRRTREPVQLINCSAVMASTEYVQENQLCTSTGDNIRHLGDPGGPLMVESPEGWVVVGVLSWTNTTGKNSTTAVFTNVKDLMPWITEIVFETF